jgi:hypothetical protein
VLVLCLSTGVALAQEAPLSVPAAPIDATAHRHLRLYLHFDLGGGYFPTSASQGGVSASVKGASALLSFAVGGSVAEDWILAGEVWGAAAPRPTGVANSNSTMALSALGLNVTHYFMPANIFLSLTPSATVLSIDNGSGNVGRTEVGFGTKLALGKEWWVGEHWGIGLAAVGFFAINRDQGTDPPTWSTFGGGLVLSATYN